ncbi:hypothetical protein P4N68_00350 [Corynebacterium felinum]|uniref:Uncharacterized protein n=1 Tax=Corynebacterium felinum TaxID=131318 RepID=A0ABU2BEC8_9CORY|nr:MULTISPECIES: hypothetical protein [Corynebacterium]MDF5819534.1 hypothetical protein [Corynebacterium felinum]MDO4762162.1 hypothetical protein [Corynebacterium sp.]MDR7356083.1 hypothetical protein [Corynebacterium felinum]WJY95417.1 hypothetical protein CFELI_09065 [Corynebacterium felinum]
MNTAANDNYWLVYLMFMFAGLLVGGTWSAYKQNNTMMTVILGGLAVLAAGAGIAWAIG